MPSGRVLQLNVKPRVPGEPGLPKKPVASSYLSVEGFAGDYNRYRQERKSASPDMAVLLIPVETLRELETEGWPMRPGDLGENITCEGLPYAAFEVGTRARVGEAVIQVALPCTPCKTLGHLPYVGPSKVSEFVKAMAGRRGWYARVLSPGLVRPGDAVDVLA